MPQPFYIAAGAVIGALIRWQLAAWFNPSWTALPLGTLLANLLGCFAIGAALALHLPTNIKLFLITGLLGSLTTFSTFAAELVQLSQRQQWQNMFTALLLHLGGGVGAVLLGAWLVNKMARG